MSRPLSSLFFFLVLSDSSFFPFFLSSLCSCFYLPSRFSLSSPLRVVVFSAVSPLSFLPGDTPLSFLYHLFHYRLSLATYRPLFISLHFSTVFSIPLFIHSSCSQLPTPFLTQKARSLPLPFELRDAQRPSTNPKREIYGSRKESRDQYHAKGKNTLHCPPDNDPTT